jgi:uncharacterized membrane protein
MKNKEIERSLQILLWIWFGVMTSFVTTNVVNIAKLETENKLLKDNITMIRNYLIQKSNKI